MRKVISLGLILVLMLGMTTSVFADFNEYRRDDEQIAKEKSSILNTDNYDKYEISLKSVECIENSLGTKEARLMVAELGKDNVKEIKKQIIDLNLSKRGYNDLQKHLFDSLDKALESGSYIDSYTIYIPKPRLTEEKSSRTAGSYYGTYNGFNFKDVFVEFDEHYERPLDENNVKKWATAGRDLVMAFTPAGISCAFTILSTATQSNIETYEVKSSRLYASDDVYQHYISIQDSYCYVGNDPNYYTTAIIDEYRRNSTEMFTAYADTGVIGTRDEISYREHVSCSTWSDSKTSQMRRGYNEYISSGGYGVSQNLVGRFSVDWE